MRIPEMYLTALPVILAGILNMVFTKTKFYRRHNRPMDGGRCLSDGRRIFGENKTWVGFFSMILLCALFQILVGLLLAAFGGESHNDLYRVYDNRLVYNLAVGFSLGLTYVLLELPNSFLKRRLDIAPGQTRKSPLGALFFLIDQIDSLIGVMGLICLFSHLGLIEYLEYLLLGGVTHAFLNITLYLMKIRRNI